jgi:hypothetical protein
VVTYVVRSSEDAFRAISVLDSIGPDSAVVPKVRFENWPKITITVPEGIGGNWRAQSTIERIVRTQFCLTKYGSADLRKLTAPDEAALELRVSYPHHTQMVIDLSGVATAMLRAAQARVASAREPSRAFETASLFATPAGKETNGNWAGAAKEVALAVVHKVSQAQATRLAMRAIMVAGLAYAAPIIWGESLKVAGEMQQRSHAHQMRLAELDRATIVAQSGQVITPLAEQAAGEQMEAEARSLMALASAVDAEPYRRFVKLAEHARPVILDLARASTIDINGLTIDATQAKAAAKAMKKNPDHGWTTVVREERA